MSPRSSSRTAGADRGPGHPAVSGGPEARSRAGAAGGSWARHRLHEWLAFISAEIHGGFGPLFNTDLEASARAWWQARLEAGLYGGRAGRRRLAAGRRLQRSRRLSHTVLRWAPRFGIALGRWPALHATWRASISDHTHSQPCNPRPERRPGHGRRHLAPTVRSRLQIQCGLGRRRPASARIRRAPNPAGRLASFSQLATESCTYTEGSTRNGASKQTDPGIGLEFGDAARTLTGETAQTLRRFPGPRRQQRPPSAAVPPVRDAAPSRPIP